MPDDEPLDDARAVGTAAAAAAARVTESVARHVSESKARERAALERAQDQQAAQNALRWVDRQTHGQDRAGSTSGRVDVQTRDQDNGRRLSEADATQSYDSTEQRGRRDAAREEAGVPLEGRRVVAVADQMNGQDPTLAAAVGKAQATRTRATLRAPERGRSR